MSSLTFRRTGRRPSLSLSRRLALLIVLAGVLLLVLGNLPAAASSLWGGESLFTDKKARRVGDLVTLIIVEQAEATHSASTGSSKGASLNIGPWSGIISDFPSLGGSASDRFEAGGTTRRGGSLRAQMTAKVVEILPNGNLVIEGRQGISINDERQELIVSGIVREQDIRPDNTVLSTYLADAQITFTGTGAIGNKQTPGLLTTLFGWLF